MAAEEPVIGVKEFSASILGQSVQFQVIRMQQSFFLWAGTRPGFKSLAVAMQTRLDDRPISTHLLGSATNVASSSLAKKLAKATNCQCFVSTDITNPSVYLATEQHLLKMLKDDPRTFYF